MSKQLIFSKKAVLELKLALEKPHGSDRYLLDRPFAASGFETLESPTIETPIKLAERVDPNSDIDTAIALHEAFPELNSLEASSVGFWTHLTHVELWEYMRARFPLANLDEEKRVEAIRKRWMLGDPSQSTLLHHPLAGLWWGVHLSVDEGRGAGKYDLTRILYRDLDLPTRTLGTYQLGRLPSAIKGILGYVYDHPDDFKTEYEAKMRYIMKHFNSMGGVLQLGCLDENFYKAELDKTKTEWISAKKKVAAETASAAQDLGAGGDAL